MPQVAMDWYADPSLLCKAIVESTEDAIITLALNGTIRSWNRGAELLYGYSSLEATGQNIRLFVPPHLKHEPETIFKKVRAGECIVRHETERLNKQQEIIQVSLTITPLKTPSGEVIGICTIARDMSDRFRAESELQESWNLIKKLSAHSDTLLEEERKLISSEVHDQLGGDLVVLRHDLKRTLGILKAGQTDENQRTAVELVGRMLESTSTTLRTTKEISTQLRPPELDLLGLTEAIRSEAERFALRTGLRCKVTEFPEDPVLDKGEALAVIRIFQEALRNIVRHAKASCVEISASIFESTFEMRIRDNGTGIVSKSGGVTNSLGILGMRERAERLGGNIEIKSAVGQGTTVMVRMPTLQQGRQRAS